MVKDYERIQKLEVELRKLMDDRNMHNADMNGWFDRMEKEKRLHAAREEEFNLALEHKQAILCKLEERIMDIEAELNSSREAQISNAHQKVGHEQCRYCFHWFNKNGLASHEKNCGMNPDIQEKKPEKALEKIDNIIENGETDQLEEDQEAKLLEAKAKLEAQLAALKKKVAVKTKAEEVDTDVGDLPLGG